MKNIVLLNGYSSFAMLFKLANKLSFATAEETILLHCTTNHDYPKRIDAIMKLWEQYQEYELVIIHSKQDFYKTIRSTQLPIYESTKKGIITSCCYELKLRPIMEYIESIQEPKTVFWGISQEEEWKSEIIRKVIRTKRTTHEFPIIGWDYDKVIDTVADMGLWGMLPFPFARWCNGACIMHTPNVWSSVYKQGKRQEFYELRQKLCGDDVVGKKYKHNILLHNRMAKIRKQCSIIKPKSYIAKNMYEKGKNIEYKIKAMQPEAGSCVGISLKYLQSIQ